MNYGMTIRRRRDKKEEIDMIYHGDVNLQREGRRGERGGREVSHEEDNKGPNTIVSENRVVVSE